MSLTCFEAGKGLFFIAFLIPSQLFAGLGKIFLTLHLYRSSISGKLFLLYQMLQNR